MPSYHTYLYIYLSSLLSQLELAVLLYRVQDVGKSKAEVAAKRVMERVNGVNIVPHFCRIEDKEIEFYSQFHIIVLGLDSIEARSYINSVACGFLGMFFLYHFFCRYILWLRVIGFKRRALGLQHVLVLCYCG